MILTELIKFGIIYAFTGAIAGIMSGILGIGGGIVVVPALLYIFQHNNAMPPQFAMHFAAGSALAIMVFTSQAAVRAHYKKGDIYWYVYQKLLPGIVLGTIIGAVFTQFLPTDLLKLLLGLFLFFVAIKMLFSLQLTKPQAFPRPLVNFLVSFAIGFKSGLLGIGGGTLIIPYLNYCGVELRRIAPISGLCTFTVGIIGSLTFIMSGWQESNLAFSTGFVYWPAVLWVALPSSFFAPIGAKLTYVISLKQLKYAFVVILLLTALNLLF